MYDHYRNLELIEVHSIKKHTIYDSKVTTINAISGRIIFQVFMYASGNYQIKIKWYIWFFRL